MIYTDELNEILRVAKTNESFLVEALAGTGKTTALIEILKVMPQASAIVLAFNTRIADEMTKRKPVVSRNRLVHVKTLHSAGMWLTGHHFPHLKIDKAESERLIDRSCEKKTSLRIRGAALKLLRLVKDFQHERELDAGYAYNLGTEMGVFDKCEGPEIQRAVEVTQQAYKHSLNVAERSSIDFPDMGWLPLVLDLQPPHRYKAVLVDEVQDCNPGQLAMIDKLLAPGGRVIACGDKFQAIYGWRGATPEETWATLIEKYNAKRMPLTVTWRCDQAIVEQANELVPDLRARPDAPAGEVITYTEMEFLDEVSGVDATSVFVLSRTNAELLRIALLLWRREVYFNITMSPEETIWPLKDIIRKLVKNLPTFGGDIMARFNQQVSAWRITEMNKAEQSGSSTWAERIEEQFLMLSYCSKHVQHPEDIMRLLDTIFTQDDALEITLSTVHKAKGMEAECVYLLKETFACYQKRFDRLGKEQAREETQEDRNILYVGITRAKRSLVYVTKGTSSE